MRQTACLVVNPIMVDSYAFLFNCAAAVCTSDLINDGFFIKLSQMSLCLMIYVFGLARRGSSSGFL